MDVKVPKLGEGAESGVVVGLLVNEGDTIAKGQTILELESEKAVAPIPASESGVVQSIRVKVGDRISAGQTILVLASHGGAPPPAPQTATQTSPVVASVPPPPAPSRPFTAASLSGPQPPASPSVRKMAEDLGIDLRRLSGSQRGGRVTVADLRQFVQQLLNLADGPPQSPAPSVTAASPANPAPSIDFSQWGPVTRKPMSSLRKVISRRMTENWTTIPHVTQFEDVDVTRLMALRKKHAAAYEAKGAKLTLTPLILKALAATLKSHPAFNASLDETAEEIVYKDYVHLGVAVDTEAGLIVPVIRDADRKSVLALSQELETLARKARDRKLSADELKGGTFTVSNQGGIGGAHFTPIVNKPEAAILGLGRSTAKAVVVDGKIEARTMMPIAISYDHRLIDGGAAARFTVDLSQAITGLDEALVAGL